MPDDSAIYEMTIHGVALSDLPEHVLRAEFERTKRVLKSVGSDSAHYRWEAIQTFLRVELQERELAAETTQGEPCLSSVVRGEDE